MTLESEQEVPMQEPEPTFPQLGKQNSILSLTLDEFQSKSGRSFGSMNMDEFLASIWNSDDNQLNNPPTARDKVAETTQSKSVAIAAEHTISQQGSISVPPPICKKTVDEVWSEIHKDHPQRNEANNNNLGRNETLRKQQTLGEITLEDFLIKAGVVQESSSLFNSSPQLRTTMPSQNQIGNAASYGLRPAIGIGFSTQHNIGTSLMLSQNNSLVAMDPSKSHAVEKCQSLPESSGCNRSKRIIDGPPEVVLERRQRRMLKNRESAARSRARRQVLCLSHMQLYVIFQLDSY